MRITSFRDFVEKMKNAKKIHGDKNIVVPSSKNQSAFKRLYNKYQDKGFEPFYFMTPDGESEHFRALMVKTKDVIVIGNCSRTPLNQEQVEGRSSRCSKPS